MPLTANQIRTANIVVEEGDTVCQNITWEVPGHPECNGQTAPVCASTLVTGESTEYISTLRTCAVRQRAIQGGIIENCVDGALGSVPTPSPNPTYAMTQDTIRFRHELNMVAQFQSRNPANYRPLTAFQQSRTRCATNPTQARNCLAVGTVNGVLPTYTPPTSPGQTAGVVLNPAYMSPAMPAWNTADHTCTLTGPQNNLGGVLAPTTCQVTETQVAANPNHTFQGTGRRVMNTDLGLNYSQLTQRISLAQMRITVHRNVDTHTFSYTYQRRNDRTCPSDSWTESCPPCGLFGCSVCVRSCSASTMQVWGPGTISGTCRFGCTVTDAPAQGNASHANQDGTGSYTDNEVTWIEVHPDDPLQAEASFAIRKRQIEERLYRGEKEEYTLPSLLCTDAPLFDAYRESIERKS